MDDFWRELLLNYGPLWAIVIGVLWWLGPLLKETIRSHKNLVDTLAQQAPLQTKAWEDTARASEASAILLQQFQDSHDELKSTVADVNGGIGEIHQKLDAIIDSNGIRQRS